MKKFRWAWLLSVVQTMIAIGLFLYAPIQYRAKVRAIQDRSPDHVVQLGLDFFFRNWPPMAEQVSWAINFPARVVSLPFNKSQVALWEWMVDDGRFQLTTADVSFFSLVGLFWFWVGSRIDSRGVQSAVVVRSRVGSVGLQIVGLGFALVIGAVAFNMLAGARQPFRVIGPFGLAWCVLLGAYFCRQLVTLARDPSGNSPVW